MRTAVASSLLLMVVAAGCVADGEPPTAAGPLAVPVFTHQGAGHGAHPANRNFRTHLTGAEEVPPVETDAQGQAVFQLSRDGSQLEFRLIVANIQNVTQAHIHQGAAGTNGPVVTWLYPAGPPPQLISGRVQGVLSEGVITSASLVGPLSGAELSDLLDLIRSGQAYVNVHTSQFPPGEIRGQIF